MRRKTFLKKSSRKLFRLSQGRALRLKRAKQQRMGIWSRHSIQFFIKQDFCGQPYLMDLSQN
ncbi:hypothetical protein ACFQ02_06635 [Seminibacterium arietis]|uniref:Uncharacterized protein n=1 Tax=Seminibacterium arietis TaxID=1173502 RepID=A0ABW3IAU2_9PAST